MFSTHILSDKSQTKITSHWHDVSSWKMKKLPMKRVHFKYRRILLPTTHGLLILLALQQRTIFN